VTTRFATLCGAVGMTLIALGIGSFVVASPPFAQAEVECLLNAVANSECEFYRNGEWFDSHRASAHLRDKHNALIAGGHFVDEVATKSSLSGRPYLMRCASGEPVGTNQWLREVLERYRRCASSPTPCAS
jgi:hypothetical protein